MKGGRSFIFAADMDERRYFWDTYVNCRPQDIKSSLMKSDAKFQAPYYLTLLNPGQNKINEGYTPQDLGGLWRESFSYSCDGRPLKVNDVCEELRRARLLRFKDDDDDDDEFVSEKRYELTDFGRGVTPYAFYLDTCKKINRYFDEKESRARRISARHTLCVVHDAGDCQSWAVAVAFARYQSERITLGKRDRRKNAYIDYRGKESFDGFQWSDLYRISTRVNYGVPQDLVSIANRHLIICCRV